MALFVFQLKCHQYWPIDEGHTVVYGNIRVHMRSKNHSEAWIERIMHVQHSEVSQTFIERFSYDLEMKSGRPPFSYTFVCYKIEAGKVARLIMGL